MFPRVKEFIQKVSRELPPTVTAMHISPMAFGNYLPIIPKADSSFIHARRNRSRAERNADTKGDQMRSRYVADKGVHGGKPQSDSHLDKRKSVCTADMSTCLCSNCRDILSQFSECTICLDPLQGVGVSACKRCGGIWCKQCTSKISRCPYCRMHNKRIGNNLALDKLINELSLPCRNHRIGCTTFLTQANRSKHEESCEFDRIICPADGQCSANVAYDQLQEHLASAHNLTSKCATEMGVLIRDLGRRLRESANARKEYQAMYLLCNQSAFKINISTHENRVSVNVTKQQIHSRPEDNKTSGFFTLIEFESSTIVIKSALPVDISSSQKHRSEIQCNNDFCLKNPDDMVFVKISIFPSENYRLWCSSLD